MGDGEWPLPDCINPNNFPAKLWRLVNNPANNGIIWDSQGEGIIIDKNNFEQQVLSPGNMPSGSADTFKTSNFSSFIRQLNLYGFKKIDDKNKSWGNGSCQHFSSPFFKQNHPELVPGLKRLTAENKAKLGTQSPESSFPLTPNQWERTSSHPYHPEKVQPGTAHNGTPVPPRYLIRDDGAALSPSVLAADKGAGVAPGCSAMHFQGLQAYCENMQYKPDYFYPYHTHSGEIIWGQGFLNYGENNRNSFCPYRLGAPKMACRGLQTGSFSPYRYNQCSQASSPVHMFSPWRENQDQQNIPSQRMKMIDINLDRVFQLADEVMQTPSNRCVVKVKTPEKPNSVPALQPRIINTSTMGGCQSSPRSVRVSISKSADAEDFLVLRPVKLPANDMTEVTSGDTKDMIITVDHDTNRH